MTFDPAAGLAREAAQRLAVVDAELPAEVDAALQDRDRSARGAEIVRTAEVTWAAFDELRKTATESSRSAVARRVEREVGASLDSSVLDAVLDSLFKR